MNIRKLDGAVMQDLFHHSLAMMGKENGMDARRLIDRLDSAKRARELISNLEAAASVIERFESVIPVLDYYTVADLESDGKRLNDAVAEWSAFCGIDPNSGETI